MTKLLNRIFTFAFCLIASVIFISCGRLITKPLQKIKTNINVNSKPFRVLVIIGDQWTDPMSYNIDPFRVKGDDFLDVVTMLKIWGVPFDIFVLMSRDSR